MAFSTHAKGAHETAFSLCLRSYMLRVRAVVMTRDDSSGGWVPMGGGGLSHVMIGKVRRPEGGRHRQYLICGERLRDQTTILECVLKQDLVYNKVNPIFHHWKVGDSKFGLTFQSPADAAAFERSVQAALEELADGAALGRNGGPPRVYQRCEGLEMLPKHITIVTSESSSSCYIRSPASEEFAFSTAQGSTPTSQVEQGCVCGEGLGQENGCRLYLCLPLPQAQPQPLQHLTLHDEEELESINPCKDLWVSKGYEDYRRAAVQKREVDPDKIAMCVHFEKGGKEHHFPAAGGGGGGEGHLRDPKGSPSCRIHAAPSPPSQKHAKEPGAGGGAGSEEDTVPSRCVYCRDVFNNEENGRGQCQDAPDPIGHCVYQLTCMWCAESMLYHCMSDSEGEYSDPCSCDLGHPHFCVRWMALAALSLVVPCMCCYLPLRACHWCGEHCGCCGGKHKAVR
uniref:Sprouty related EVH1 domain containing 3 n=1 Tax=Pelusios castaneus TaxID=367368 RepID=A0A8C8S1P8_9SAUR